MKNIRVFLPENFQFLEVKFSIYEYLNRRVFVMIFIFLVVKAYRIFEQSCFRNDYHLPHDYLITIFLS